MGIADGKQAKQDWNGRPSFFSRSTDFLSGSRRRRCRPKGEGARSLGHEWCFYTFGQGAHLCGWALEKQNQGGGGGPQAWFVTRAAQTHTFGERRPQIPLVRNVSVRENTNISTRACLGRREMQGNVHRCLKQEGRRVELSRLERRKRWKNGDREVFHTSHLLCRAVLLSLPHPSSLTPPCPPLKSLPPRQSLLSPSCSRLQAINH